MTPGPEAVATVVVYEDDRVTLDLLCDRLASDRFEPLAAGTAEEALRLCRHQRPDLRPKRQRSGRLTVHGAARAAATGE